MYQQVVVFEEPEIKLQLLNPYLEPVPQSAYKFSVSDDIYIDFGVPIDPQGFEVQMDITLGSAAKFLQTDDKVVSVRTNSTAKSSTETSESGSEGDKDA